MPSRLIIHVEAHQWPIPIAIYTGILRNSRILNDRSADGQIFGTVQPREKMNMKRSLASRATVKKSVLALVTLSALAGVTRAAEGSIEIYAILDDSVAHIEHSLPTSDVHTFGFNSYNVPGQDQG